MLQERTISLVMDFILIACITEGTEKRSKTSIIQAFVGLIPDVTKLNPLKTPFIKHYKNYLEDGTFFYFSPLVERMIQISDFLRLLTKSLWSGLLWPFDCIRHEL